MQNSYLPFSAVPRWTVDSNRCCSILSSCQRGKGEVSGSKPAHSNQRFLHAVSRAAFWTSGIFLEAEPDQVLLVRSSNAVLSSRKKLLFFQKSKKPGRNRKDSPRTAVRLAFCSCAGSILTDPGVEIPEQFHSADALA